MCVVSLPFFVFEKKPGVNFSMSDLEVCFLHLVLLCLDFLVRLRHQELHSWF